MPLERIVNLFSGLRDSLQFSNYGELIFRRLMSRNAPIVHYEWKNKWHMYCDTRVDEHGSVKPLLAGGAYDPYIRQSSQSGKCSYVNVGANVGGFDIAVAAQDLDVPYGLSVELNPRTFTRLALNIGINSLDTIRIRNAGIAGKSGSYRFIYRKNYCSLTDNIFETEESAGTGGADVDLLTLSDAIAEAGMQEKTFDLLKLDCEGAEYGIIENSTREELRKFAHIVMELHTPPPDHTPEKLYAKLSECGFQGGDPAWTAAEGPEVRFWKKTG